MPGLASKGCLAMLRSVSNQDSFDPSLIFFVPAVTISARQGGGGPGLLATALAAALCKYNYFPPIGSLAISHPNDVTRMVGFVFEGILTSVLMERLHRARRQAEENRREADGFREASRRGLASGDHR
jgi:K+-sensing histidine kinase KdpD